MVREGSVSAIGGRPQECSRATSWTAGRVVLGAVTPVAVGGAEGPRGPAEGLRVASLRGALRFWFRDGAGGGMEPTALLQVEQAVFGGGRAGAVVDLWITPGHTERDRVPVRMNDPAPRGADGLVPKRQADMPPSWWTLDVRFRRHVKAWQRDAFSAALGLLLLPGGLGGRWRRGFGSLWTMEAGRFTDPVVGGDRAARCDWIRGRVCAALASLRFPGVPVRPVPPGVRSLRDLARLYLIELGRGHGPPANQFLRTAQGRPARP